MNDQQQPKMAAPNGTRLRNGSPRSSWAPMVIVLLVVGLPIAELAGLIIVGRWIGIFPLLGLLFVKALLGAWLSQREGGRALRKISEAAQTASPAGAVSTGTGVKPTGTGAKPSDVADAALVPVGGFLLIAPGFLTDLVGLCFLLRPLRPLARRVLGWGLKLMVRRRYGVDLATARARMDRQNVVPGEVVDPTPGAASRPGDHGEVISGEIEA